MATALNFPSADADILIRGDDNAVRTITIGQQGTFKDRVVIDSENFGVTTLGAGRLTKLNIEVGATDAQDALVLTQNDDSESFGELVATSAASTVNPLTTFTTGNTIQGFARWKVNGVLRWFPFYDAPTS